MSEVAFDHTEVRHVAGKPINIVNDDDVEETFRGVISKMIQCWSP